MVHWIILINKTYEYVISSVIYHISVQSWCINFDQLENSLRSQDLQNLLISEVTNFTVDMTYIDMRQFWSQSPRFPPKAFYSISVYHVYCYWHRWCKNVIFCAEEEMLRCLSFVLKDENQLRTTYKQSGSTKSIEFSDIFSNPLQRSVTHLNLKKRCFCYTSCKKA